MHNHPAMREADHATAIRGLIGQVVPHWGLCRWLPLIGDGLTEFNAPVEPSA